MPSINPGSDSAGSAQSAAGIERWHGRGWLALLWVTVVVGVGVTDRPAVFGSRYANDLLFWGSVAVLIVGGTAVLLNLFVTSSLGARLGAAAAALAAWTILVLIDDRWSLATFALYAVCFVFGSRVGIPLAAYVSIVWAVSLRLHDSPLWASIMPLGVFAVSSILALTIQRISALSERQTELIAELRAAQRDLVDSERTKGVLTERARMAAEIHDTLAQGFTSIVLLSRAGMRSGDATDALKSIEQTAQDNLGDARRLIEAIRPPELGVGSLSMALQRQLEAALPQEVDRNFSVEGQPRALSGAVEVTVLRAAQEALLNIRNHARAKKVDMVLRFHDDSVVLDVADDGVGFTAGQISDRGELTGGQGLALLASRAESLAGQLTVRSPGDGSHLSLSLPAGRS